MDLLIPTTSPVRFVAIGQCGAAMFGGRFRLPGHYHCGAAQRDRAALDFHFFPDQEMRSRLPFWHKHRQVVELHFDNIDEFLGAALREPVLRGLRAGSIPAVSGRVTIWVDGYQASIEHAQPVYKVRYLSIDTTGPADSRQQAAGLIC